MFLNQVLVNTAPLCLIAQNVRVALQLCLPSHLPALLLQLLLSLGQLGLKGSDDHLLASSGPSVFLTQAVPELLDLPLQLLPPTLCLS